MKKYFKVIEDTKAWRLFHKLWTHQDKWFENKEEIERVIGCEMDKNLIVATKTLMLANPPEHLRTQFKKNPNSFGSYEAKKNSEVRKEFLELIDKLGLEEYNAVFLSWELDIPDGARGYQKTYHPPMNGEYFFSVDGGDWSECKWCKEVDEPTFLRLRADWLEAREK